MYFLFYELVIHYKPNTANMAMNLVIRLTESKAVGTIARSPNRE